MQPNIPAGVDMGLILEAMQRRQQTGAGTPPTQQMTTPQASLPTGAPNTPTTGPAPVQNPQQNVTPQSPVSPEGAVVGQLKAGASFDDETKKVAKQLVAKLIGVL